MNLNKFPETIALILVIFYINGKHNKALNKHFNQF